MVGNQRPAGAHPVVAVATEYRIYLINEPAQKLLALALAPLARGHGGLFTAIWVPSAILVPLALAWVLHRQVEQPAVRAGRALIEQPVMAPV